MADTIGAPLLQASSLIRLGMARQARGATGDATDQQAQLAAIAYADRIRALGLSPEEALALAESALRRLPSRSRRR